MRIVVDCNVIISAGITKNGVCDQVIGAHEWVITSATEGPVAPTYGRCGAMPDKRKGGLMKMVEQDE